MTLMLNLFFILLAFDAGFEVKAAKPKGFRVDIDVEKLKGILGYLEDLAFQTGVSALSGGGRGPKRPKGNEPPLPPNNNDDVPFPSLCMDLMLVIDVSCSILPPERERARTFAMNLVENILASAGNNVKVGLLLYSLGTLHQFHLRNGVLEGDEILESIKNAELTSAGCRTHTHTALHIVRENYFIAPYDRSEAPNVLMLFTDGRTIEAKYRKDTIEEANLTRSAGIELNVIALENRKLKPDVDEFELVPNDASHFFNISDPNLMSKVVDSFTDRHINAGQCPPQSESNDGCVDIAFAFDFSCSINIEDRETAVSIAAEIVHNTILSPTNASIVTAFSFDDKIGNRLPFSSGNRLQFIEKLRNIDKTGFGCRTKTYDAFIEASDIFTNKDRNDTLFGDVLIMFGDGMTAPFHRKAATVSEAKKLNGIHGVTIIWVVFPNNRGKNGMEDEIKLTATSEENIFTDVSTNREKIIDDILLFLRTRFPCSD